MKGTILCRDDVHGHSEMLVVYMQFMQYIGHNSDSKAKLSTCISVLGLIEVIPTEMDYCQVLLAV